MRVALNRGIIKDTDGWLDVLKQLLLEAKGRVGRIMTILYRKVRSTGLLARIVGVTVLQPRLALVTSPPTNPSRLHKSYSFLSSLAFSFQKGFVTRNWHRPATLLCHGIAQSTHSRATLGLMTLVESTALF